MTTIVTRAGKGSALTWIEADANFTNLNTAKLESVQQDTAPKLGANLDVNSFSIVSSTNGNINITPNGTGIVNIKGVKVGPGAGSIATNTAVGTSGLSSNTTGAHNTTIGASSLAANTSGSYNTAAGEFSLFGNTNANNNTGLGYGTLYRNANAANNTAVGTAALNNTVGAGNTAIGKDAGKILDTGTDNTFIGLSSGSAVTTGSYNLILGNNTGSTIATLSNRIIISDGQGNIRISVDNSGNSIVNGQITANRFNINTTDNTGSSAIGQIAWNDGEGCLEYLLKGGNVNLQIGQETVLQITNNTGSTLSDGQLVYISGSSGQLPTVTLANANSEATSSKTIGMVTESILNGSNGFITTNGIVHGLNTIAYSAGTGLWLDTIAGNYSSTKPTSPNHGVFIGWVVRSHATNGSIYVHIQNGYELDELHDVLISSLSNNQLLKYNSTSSVWENWTPNFLSSSDIGTTVQAYDSDLTAWSSVSTSAKQDTLISGTNIKTINGNNVLGAGNITIEGGTGGSSGFEQTFLLMGC